MPAGTRWVQAAREPIARRVASLVYSFLMAQGLRELVGRAMIDPDFLAALQRAPDAILAEYELSELERATIREALTRLAKTPPNQRGPALSNALIRRVAT